MGSFNMRKQQTSGLDFIKYLALQNKHFKLTPSGEILGMDRYKQNARNTQQFSLPGEDYTQDMSITNHTLDANANIQIQTDSNAGIEGTIPNPPLPDELEATFLEGKYLHVIPCGRAVYRGTFLHNIIGT